MTGLSVQHVGASLEGRPILFDMDFKVEPNGVTALLGRNGMGKTTMLKTIMGLAPTVHGQVEFDGISLNPLATHQRRRAGILYVPEDAGVFQTLTVEENLRIGACQPIRSVLEPFGELKPLWRKPAGLLSGGERKILAFARAWLSDARCFLIDEPSLGLAPAVIKRLAAAVRTLASKGGVLLVEQNLRLAESVSDRYVLVVLGRSVDSGPIDALRDSEAYRSGVLQVAGGES